MIETQQDVEKWLKANRHEVVTAANDNNNGAARSLLGMAFMYRYNRQIYTMTDWRSAIERYEATKVKS